MWARTAVVGCVLVVGLGLIGAAQELSGFAFSSLWLDLGLPGGQLGLQRFLSVVDIDYTVCGFTFGTTAVVRARTGAGGLGIWGGQALAVGGLQDVYFDAYGWLGAVYFSSYVWFDAVTTVNPWWVGGVDPVEFQEWATIAWLNLAGVDLYGLGLLSRQHAQWWPEGHDEDDVGMGFAVGAQGMAGQCTIAVEAQFNLAWEVTYPGTPWAWWSLYWRYNYLARGWDCVAYEPGVNFFEPRFACFDWDWIPPSAQLWVVQTDCHLVFTAAEILVGYPFCCLDLWTNVRFTCEGFDFIAFNAYDIVFGDCVWLELDRLTIWFTTQTKTVTFNIDLNLCDLACISIEPFFELDWDRNAPTLLNGIQLIGLVFECDFDGVIVKAGTMFDPNALGFDAAGNRFPGYEPQIPCDEAWFDYCAYYNTWWYDEFFAVIVDGDSCCGGGFDAAIFNWFDIGDDAPGGDAAGLFDWEQTVIELRADIGWNTTLLGGLSVFNEGLDWIRIGLNVRL